VPRTRYLLILGATISLIDTQRTRYSPIKLGRFTARDSALSERAAAAAVWVAMKAKTKIGMGMKSNKKTTRKKATKKRILPTAKRDGALPFLPMLGALESLIGGRHDRAMEQGRELYLAPYKNGRGLYLGPYKHGQGVAAKKKKCRKDNKNAV